jgi:drug/metabolite transporter (DMT)-like permease
MRPYSPARSGITSALGAAALFGASTPLAKLLTGEIAPVLLAGLLYLGSGLGLLVWFLLQRMAEPRRAAREAVLTWRDAPWLAGAILAGGVIGPVLLMFGLAHTGAATASLLLNFEGVFTALFAWFVFRENFDRRIAFGMALIVAGGVLLSWHGEALAAPLAALAIVGACLAWAIDNNLTRKIASGDPVQIAGLKGLIAGLVNTGLALGLGDPLPGNLALAAAGAVGALGYGVSLVLFVLALRHLGSARTGAYFSTAPFIGAAVSLAWFHETPGLFFWAAAGLMAAGIWLHLTERHAHPHAHEALAHTHRHIHDAHHQHAHPFPWDGVEPHAHHHAHEPLMHSHPHYPDIHHRHRH